MFRPILQPPPWLALAAALWLAASIASAQALRFGVLNQRSPQLIAQYRSPVLAYVSHRSGVALELGADNRDYDNFRRFDRGTAVRDATP